jgi:hypothetical protein
MNKFVPPEITKKEVEAGHMSPLALYEPFKNITHYPPEYQDAGKFSHIPILSEKGKVSSEWENFHHYGFIRLSDQFLKDGLYLYTHYPQYYLKRLGYAWFQYFTSAHRALYALVARDNKAIRFIAGIYDYIFYGELPFNMGGMFGGSVYRAPFLFLILGLPVLFIFALWMAFKKPIDKIPINENQRVMLFYMCLVIAYVALVGNALEIPENNRFRFLTDAFYVTIFGLVVQFYILPYFKHNHPPSV